MDIPNKYLRRRLLKKGFEMNSVHFTSSLSCLDSIKYLYDNILTTEDIFILSKAHGDLALYAVLEEKGKNVPWTPHLNYEPDQGIYATTGSLGHGLPIGLGRAFAKKIKKEPGRIFVLTGDGEMEEGSNWEALSLASKLKIDNLILLVDWNKYQAVGSVSEVGGYDDKILRKRLEAFGCNVITIDGHYEKGINKNGLEILKYLPKGINGIILDTIKGKGVRCLEESHSHGYEWKEYEKIQALEELK